MKNKNKQKKIKENNKEKISKKQKLKKFPATK